MFLTRFFGRTLLAAAKSESSVTTAASAATRSARNPLEEFFELDRILDEEKPVIYGRSWKASELRLKSWDDLQKLWFVLLKEKNMLMTQRQMLNAQNLRFPNPERLPKITSRVPVRCTGKYYGRALYGAIFHVPYVENLSRGRQFTTDAGVDVVPALESHHERRDPYIDMIRRETLIDLSTKLLREIKTLPEGETFRMCIERETEILLEVCKEEHDVELITKKIGRGDMEALIEDVKDNIRIIVELDPWDYRVDPEKIQIELKRAEVLEKRKKDKAMRTDPVNEQNIGKV